MNTIDDFESFESIVFKFDGIIYGGYVRDKIINEYRKSFMIVPNDMDIFFKKEEIANKFIEELASFGDIIKTTNNDNTYTGLFSIIQHKQISVINGNKSFTFDISFPYKNTESECQYLEPPFYNLDMECNGFLMDVSGIRYSSMTGTYLDTLKSSEQKKELIRIIHDMYKMQTNITTIGGLKIEEPYIVGRILKMINRKSSWKILNAPFKYQKRDFICKCCNEISFKSGYKVGKFSYDKECFFDKLYRFEFKRELNLIIDEEHLAFI
jgi:hypothetical protein